MGNPEFDGYPPLFVALSYLNGMLMPIKLVKLSVRLVILSVMLVMLSVMLVILSVRLIVLSVRLIVLSVMLVMLSGDWSKYAVAILMLLCKMQTGHLKAFLNNSLFYFRFTFFFCRW